MDKLLQCCVVDGVKEGFGMVDEKMAVGLERLREQESVLLNEQEYIAATQNCIAAFKKLHQLLNAEQQEALFEYESTLAEKELMTYSILGISER